MTVRGKECGWVRCARCYNGLSEENFVEEGVE